MPEIIRYLPLRAVSEHIYLMIAYGNLPIKIEPVTWETWPAFKAEKKICPFGQLPSIELESGEIIAQSRSIARYVAGRIGLLPSDPLELMRADTIYELGRDMNTISPLTVFFDCSAADYQAKKDAYFADAPGHLTVAQNMLGDKSFFGGDRPHYGDFSLWHDVDLIKYLEPTFLTETTFPGLNTWYARFAALPGVAEYLTTRPSGVNASRPKSAMFVRESK